jgi:hypothetical protein
MKIRELELKLLEKEKEIITVRYLLTHRLTHLLTHLLTHSSTYLLTHSLRAKRYEELEPEVLKDRLGDAKLLVRSKHLDEWSVDEVAAMLTELKMNEYVEFVQKNKVDGNLFINLSDDDWYVIPRSLSSYSLTHSLTLTHAASFIRTYAYNLAGRTDMGIINKFHRRKLQLYLKSFRTRYENKQNRIGDDDDLMSEYAPSEVLTHSLTHSRTHSLTYLLTHSLTHSLGV